MDKEIISSETLESLNAAIKNLFHTTSAVLEEAGVPHTNTDEVTQDASALGVSTSVDTPVNFAPWIVVSLGLFIGISLLVTAIMKSLHPTPEPTSADRISAAVDEIVTSKRMGKN